MAGIQNNLHVHRMKLYHRDPIIDQSEKFKNYFNTFDPDNFRNSLPKVLKRTGGRNEIALYLLDHVFKVKGLHSKSRTRFTLHQLGTLLLKMGISKDQANTFITIARAHQMGSDDRLTTQKLDISQSLLNQKEALFFSCDSSTESPFVIEKRSDVYYQVSDTLEKTISPEERAQYVRSSEGYQNSSRPISPLISPKPKTSAKKKLSSDLSHRFNLEAPAPYGPKRSPIQNPIYIGRVTQDLRNLNQNAVLTDDQWGNIFSLINTQTANTPYAVQNDFINLSGKKIYRPNHNGTHSARQVRLLKELLNLVYDQSAFTQEQKNSLILAAYCYRLGRVDESGMGHDQNRLRSAQVYKAYAKQLNFSTATIDWTFQIISRDYNTPLSDQKQELAYTLLDTAHRLDLQRCYFNMSAEIPMIENNLALISPSGTSSKALRKRLMTFSEKLIKATGCKNNFKNISRYTYHIFSRMSLDGKACMQALNQIYF